MRVLLDGNVQLTGDGDDVEVGRSVPKERLEAEFARIQGLDDDGIEAMCSIIGAKDVSDVVRKISRFMLANSNPGLMLGRTFETEGPGGFEAFCLRLSSYRKFLARIEQGVIARDAVNEVLSEQKARLVETMRPLLDEFEESEHVWMRIDADVYDDDDEIDLGELRAEIDRLLHHLEVDPRRIHVSLVPAGKNPPTDRRTPEETLFADLLFLLQRHGERIDGKPTRRVLTVVVNVLAQLRQQGNLPESDPSDITFLARLIAVLDQLRGRATAPFLLALADSIRDQLLNEELLDTTLDSDGDDDGDAPDGGVPLESNGETPNDNGISGSGVCRCPAGTYQQIAPGRRAPRYWHGGRAGHDLNPQPARVVVSSNDIYSRLRRRFAGSMQEQFVVLALVEPLYDVTVERYMRFGREVMLARVKKNLTQTAVARAVGRTLNYYARIERGRQLPSLLLFARMHNGLGFDANRVLEAMGEEPEERAYGPHSRLGVYLAHARDQCEQTIASAAKAVGCSAEAYERIELGERLPTLAELVRMHRVVRFNANIVLRRIDLELLDQDGT